MGLITLKELFQSIPPAGAVCGFDFLQLEQVKAVVAAAEDLNSPVILMVTEGGVRYAGLEYIAALGRTAASGTSLPVVFHLDHCTSYQLAEKAICAGFSSVMIDGSMLPFDENVSVTRDVVKAAHSAGVSVEAELGRVGGKEDGISAENPGKFMTDPEEAAEFVEKTGVDCLAVAVGTAHGLYKGTPVLNFTLLEKIRDRLDLPLVLHGGSDLPDETVRKAIESGIRKLNIWTDLAVAQTGAIRRFLSENPGEYDPRKVFAPGTEAMKKVVEKKIRLARGY
ncbi:MAG: class II fructose-bisphosphate aldolase [Bacillota bacterium]